MRNIKRTSLFIGFFSTIISVGFTQIPDGYYDSAAGLSGENLRTALETIIDDHSSQSYTSLWTHFKSTDDKANGKVWDMYSDVPGGTPAYEYTFVTNQCGNYGAEGDCYNREHSFPKSWFGDILPMNTDLFHLYPTDGYTNGRRSNYPFGEVGTASWTSTNGCKLGTSSYSGYTGNVFEPIDEYKGDFARSYFYMLTRYKDLISGWSSNMLSGNDFTDWAKNMLLEWHENDAVSTKETDRNNVVYGIQNNRNPFIDHPEYVDLIWGEAVVTALSYHISHDKIIHNIMPQPAVNEIILNITKHNAKNAMFKIFDIHGKIIQIITIQGDEFKDDQIRINLNRENLSSGIYFYKFEQDDFHLTGKLILK